MAVGDHQRNELVAAVTKSLKGVANELDDAQLRALVIDVLDITCDIALARERQPEGDIPMGFLRIGEGGTGGGTSRKPINIRLRPDKLLGLAAKAAGAVAGAAAHPLLAVLAAMGLWMELLSIATVELQEREATVVWTLLVTKDQRNMVPKTGLLASVNKERAAYGRAPLTQRELDDSLALLRRIGSIDSSVDVPDAWLVREGARARLE